jgi:hypothetical protein
MCFDRSTRPAGRRQSSIPSLAMGIVRTMNTQYTSLWICLQIFKEAECQRLHRVSVTASLMTFAAESYRKVFRHAQKTLRAVKCSPARQT